MEKRYYKHKIENLLLISKIIMIHYLEFDRNFQSEREAHDFWELVYADRGDIICEADGKEFPLCEGEMFFHRPGETHSFRANGEDRPSVCVVCFDCKNEAVRFFENKRIAVNKKWLRFIYGIIEESERTFHTEHSDPTAKKMQLLDAPALGGRQLIKNYLELLLINMMREETEKEYSDAVFLSPAQYEEHVTATVTEYLKAHVTERIGITDICEAVHYNKSYLFKQFKKVTGQSVMSYFIQLKIGEAKKLLRETALSVSEIADTLAFDTPNYFTKSFKRVTGRTPSEYRKSKKKSK